MKPIELLLHKVEGSEQDHLKWKDFEIGYFIQKNESKSERNEDVLFIYAKDSVLIFGVADGAGGHQFAAETSYIIGENILKYARSTKPESYQFMDLIEQANQQVREECPDSYSTLSLCYVNEGAIRSYSVGDSEVHYISHEGEIIYNNIPQSPVGHAVEAGLLDQEDSLDHQERHLVNNLMGDDLLRVEVASKFKLETGSKILVGSDGLFDNYSHDEIYKVLTVEDFSDCFSRLKEFCAFPNEHWRKDDDISFVLISKNSNR